jgi:hypothetical protein
MGEPFEKRLCTICRNDKRIASGGVDKILSLKSKQNAFEQGEAWPMLGLLGW